MQVIDHHRVHMLAPIILEVRMVGWQVVMAMR
jgi:hypothetical protein